MVQLNPLLLALAAPLTAATAPNPNPNCLTTLCSRQPPLGNGTPLRIMPLGASITYGIASSDGNGYRSHLRTTIISSAGNKVNMVGSRQAGTMRDNDVEGWPGLRIEQVHEKAKLSVPKWKPNVVLINAGTNDAVQGWNVSTAGQRMEDMIQGVWKDSPRAVVVLSALLVNQGVEAEKNVQVINAQLRELVSKLAEKEGTRIVLAEMHGDKGPQVGELKDGTHPTDGGYRKMAAVWFEALGVASGKGWLMPPEKVEGVPDDGAA